MSDTFTFTLKPIVELSDAKANIGVLQREFNKLKLPDKITNKLNNEINNFNKAYDNVQKKMAEGIKTSGDFTQLQKGNNMMVSSWSNIAKIIKEVSNMDMTNILRFDTENIREAQKQLADLEQQLNSISLNKTQSGNIQKAIEEIQGLTKSSKVKDLTSNMLEGLKSNDFKKVFDNYIQLKKHHSEFINMFGSKTTNAINNLGTTLEKNTNVSGEITQNIINVRDEVDKLRATEEQEAQLNISNRADDWNEEKNAIAGVTKETEEVTRAQLDYNKSISKIESQIESYFGLNAIFRKVANMAREAMNTVKELDKAMTETAVVTNFSVGDMWEKLPIYTAEANKLGSTIKDVYEATTLYYQQGLNTTQSMGLAVETLKMARIAGMDAKDATDAMTAALRGFNLEINQASAQRINDVYSQLAANTASNTQEISTAMEKVASLAHNAGMELETTAAFLAQMIETTREAPENLGTALKTVVARFQEMKQDPTKLVDSEGVMLDANKVDKALKSIGVQLMDTNGQFRKLDDVFLEIASKWDTLTMGQQRYIATMAAGSRQQSRFIAMMSNYSRTIELVDMAYDASGASQRQFEKTLESMDSKLNKLKNAYDQFIMGLMNNQFLKNMVDLGTDALGLINKIIDGISSWTGPLKGTTKMLLTLISTFGGLTAAKGLLQSGIGLGVQWFGGKEAKNKYQQRITGKSAEQLAEESARKSSFNIFNKGLQTQYKEAQSAGKTSGSLFGYAFTNARNQVLQSNPITPVIQSQVLGWKDVAGVAGNGTFQQQEALRQYLRGEIGKEGLANELGLVVNKQGEFVQQTETAITKSAKFAQNTQLMGASLQAFGMVLQNTPLAPFGKALQIVGVGMQAFGGIAAKAATIYSAGAAGVTTSTTGMAGGFRALGIAIKDALAPFVPFLIAMAAVAAIGFVLYREFTKDKREMEALAEAAKISSDAFDNLKTATEELKSSIEEIRNSDNLFDGLVVGTTEWNLALVEANQQVLDLIKKYPILQKYMTTDATGRMRISEAGFKAVQDEQNRKLGQAQALDILTNAEHNAKLLEQEQKKIFKDEKITNTVAVTYEFDENGAATMHTELVESYNQLSEEGQQEWDSIQAKIDAESAAAREQAVRAALSASGELNNTVISLFGQNLDEVTKQFEGETNLDTIKYAYAEFIGGVYDPLTKALTDASGEEVPIDDDALKQIYPQIMALLQFQEEAPRVEAALKSLGREFDSVFGSGKGNSFLRDLLNNNLEIDTSNLEISNDEIVEAVNKLDDDQVHAIMGRENATHEDLVKLLTDNRDKLKAAQASTYADAAVWYAKSRGTNARTAGLDSVTKQYANKITQGLTVGSAAAVNKFMNQVSQSFDSVTAMQMGNNLFDILLGTNLEAQEKVNELINSIDWSSAIERGSLYSQFNELTDEGKAAFEALTPAQQKFIRNQKKVDKSLDLTGKQFEELVQSSDFLDILTEKWSDFTNESGKLDASGVEAMAKECGTLNKLLELGEFDAYQLATALNYFQDSGSFDGMTSAVLEAIKSFNSLDKLIGQVKKDVDEFQPGESYEQGMDAYRDYMDSLTEAYEHRKYSSADTLSYAQRFIGEDEWETFVSEHGQSNKSAEKAIIDSLKTIFTDNEEDTTINILKRLANGKTLLGGEAEASDIFSAYYDELGNLKLKIDPKATRDDFVNALVKERGFTEEMARSFLLSLEGQDWGFLEDNLTKGFDLAGREGGIKAYIEGIRDRGQIPAGTPTGNIVLTEAELEALKSMGGYESIDKVIADLANQLGIAAENIQLFNAETEGAAEYLAKLNGTTNTTKEQTREQAVDFLGANKGVVDFTAVTQKLEQTGINATKALDMAIDMAHEAGVEQVKWGDQLVDVSDIINGDQFNEAVEKLEDASQWETVGQTIGDTIVAALYDSGFLDRPSGGTSTQDISQAADNANSAVVKVNLEIEKNLLENQLIETNQQVTNLKNNIELLSQTDPTNPDLPQLQQELAAAEERAINVTNALQGVYSQLDKITQKNFNINFTSTINGVASTIADIANSIANIKPKAKGQNNYISSSGFYTGSAARGAKGTLGPHNRGGLTLTGEEGFEIAWLPSENRSMIVGAHGPQMVNLPSNATVWNHEQSKKIVKQKGIPMGSMTTGTYDTGGSGSSGSGSGSSSSSKGSSKNKDSEHSNWYKEEVTRFNLNQKINKITQEIERTTQTISDALEKIGTKYADIANDVEKQAQLLNQTIAEQEKLRDSYRKELEWLANGNRQLWISLTNTSNESQEIQISTSQFITGNAEIGYSISYAAIENYLKANGFGGDNLIANAEALFNLLNQQISNLQSGFDNAVKAIEEAQKKLQELIEQIKEAFYAYENELTKIYDLTAKLATNEAQLARFSSQTSLLLARIAAGFETVESAAGKLIKMQQADAEYIKTRIQLLKDEIQTRRQDLASLLDRGKAELAYYNQIVAENKAKGSAVTIDDQAREQAAYDAYARAAWAQKYVRKTRMQDGTYVFDLDEDKLAADIAAGNISQETYDIIKEGFDQMQEDNLDLNNAISEAADYMAEIYQTYGEHIKTMADLEKDLIDAFIDAAQKEVKKLEALNSSLSAAIKSVLDQVKKSIDLRRKAEDNTKTENDIAKKQQRLNALRANTNGGNAVEIAQLEKEIAEAQQSYGRSLEDQMLSQMQTQADEAAKQRQEQIDLAKQQIEYNKQAGVYAAHADELLVDLQSNQSAIQEILASTYELGRGEWTKLVDDSNIRQQVAEALIAWSAIPDLQEVLDSLGEDFSNFLYGMDEELGSSDSSGGKPKDFGIHRPDVDFGNGISKGDASVRNNAHGKLKQVPEVDQDQLTFEQVTLLQEGLRDLQSDGIIELDTPIVPTGVLNSQTEQALKALQQKIDNKRVTGRWDTRFAQIVHRKLRTYKEGGLADFTGPAWLDGTKAKPELILNAQDTKNFMVLKDILSDVIRGVNHIDRAETYNNPVEFNINVNVDKITSDYDVDKLTARIKHDIVKDATYRNVTQVRNFR